MYLFENVCFNLNDPISFWIVDHYDWNSKPDHVSYTFFHHRWIYQAHEYTGGFIDEILRNVKHFHGLETTTGELTKEQCRDNPWNNFLPISERRELFSPANILNKGYIVFAAGSRRKNPPIPRLQFLLL